METKFIQINQNEADVVVSALEAVAVQYRELATKLILDTNSRQAGFNKLDSADLIEQFAQRIDNMFYPEVD